MTAMTDDLDMANRIRTVWNDLLRLLKHARDAGLTVAFDDGDVGDALADPGHMRCPFKISRSL